MSLDLSWLIIEKVYQTGFVIYNETMIIHGLHSVYDITSFQKCFFCILSIFQIIEGQWNDIQSSLGWVAMCTLLVWLKNGWPSVEQWLFIVTSYYENAYWCITSILFLGDV